MIFSHKYTFIKSKVYIQIQCIGPLKIKGWSIIMIVIVIVFIQDFFLGSTLIITQECDKTYSKHNEQVKWRSSNNKQQQSKYSTGHHYFKLKKESYKIKWVFRTKIFSLLALKDLCPFTKHILLCDTKLEKPTRIKAQWNYEIISLVDFVYTKVRSHNKKHKLV